MSAVDQATLVLTELVTNGSGCFEFCGNAKMSKNFTVLATTPVINLQLIENMPIFKWACKLRGTGVTPSNRLRCLTLEELAMTRCRTVSMLAVVAMTAILVAAPARADVIYWTGAVDTNWTALAPGSNWDQAHDPSNCPSPSPPCSSQDVRVTNEMNGVLGSQTIKYNASDATIDFAPFPDHNSVLVSGFGAGKSMTISHSLPLGLFFAFDPASSVTGTLSVGGEGGTGIYNQSGGFVNPVFLNLGGGAGGRGTYNLTAVGSDPSFPTFLPKEGLNKSVERRGRD